MSHWKGAPAVASRALPSCSAVARMICSLPQTQDSVSRWRREPRAAWRCVRSGVGPTVAARGAADGAALAVQTLAWFIIAREPLRPSRTAAWGHLLCAPACAEQWACML